MKNPSRPSTDAGPLRNTILLDGAWQIEQGRMDRAPREFSHTVVVPGLIDMADPAFAEVGVKSSLREAFWYRRTFQLDSPVPAVAMLKVHKAMFGTKVIFNGVPVGEHLPCFTPGCFDARAAIRSGENEILIRVGAFRDAVPESIPRGWDEEKKRYIPGIFDSVELILCGSPHIVRVQAVPDIENSAVTVHAWVRSIGSPVATKLHCTVREASTGRVAGEADCEVPAADAGPEQKGQATIAIDNCRLWSPEDPFLYELDVRGEADALTTRFGMRTFRLDPATGRAILNGRPYFMRGSNVVIYRFFEDAERGDKPWREEWIRHLHKAFRSMHWNALRYSIGFPPESWYRIADEEGLLIQDEFPYFFGGYADKHWPPPVKSDELVREFTEWMQERWNHPCVVIWDAQNETRTEETGKAIRAVRGLDLSARPWDNGYGPPQDPADSYEAHPYVFHTFRPTLRLSMFSTLNPAPGQRGSVPCTALPAANAIPNKGNNPIVINEYGIVFLNRDGTPTTASKPIYEALLGLDSTVSQRRELGARLLAAETEFWRCHRKCAAVMHFVALTDSRPDGVTSDHWTDVERLTFEPEFFRYVRDAFSPVALMIDTWSEVYPPGPCDFPVVVINDLYELWRGTVRFRLLGGTKTVAEKSQPCEVPPLGNQDLVFTIDLPTQPGRYQLEATLVSPGAEPVRSLRDFTIPTTLG